MIIRSRAPVRISFGGGGTDVPPYCDERGGCVVSAAINKFSYGTLESRNDGDIELESENFKKKLRFSSMDDMSYNNELDLLKAVVKTLNSTKMGLNIFLRSEVPPKSGLGGSASCFVSLIGLFNHLRRNSMTNYEIAELAHRLEREELKIAGGKQDQYAAVFGGINYIEFGKGWVRVNPLRLKKDHILEMEKHFVLAYVGDRPKEDVTREYITGKIKTDDIIGDQVKSVVEKKESVMDALDKTKEIAQEMRRMLMAGDLIGFGELMHRAWEEKKKFSKGVSNPYIDNLYSLARKHGAIGERLQALAAAASCCFSANQTRSRSLQKSL